MSSSSSSSFTPRILIIGCGLAGLSVAISLQQYSIHCIIYERDLTPYQRKQGYGLTLTNQKNGALDKLGVLTSCLQQDVPSWEHYIFNGKGTVLGYYGRELKYQYDDHKREQEVQAQVQEQTQKQDEQEQPQYEQKEEEEEQQQQQQQSTLQPRSYLRNCVRNLRIPREDLRRLLLSRCDISYVHIVYGVYVCSYRMITSHDIGVVSSDGRYTPTHEDIMNGLIRIEYDITTTTTTETTPTSAAGVASASASSSTTATTTRHHDYAHLIVGADGIYSCVRTLREQQQQQREQQQQEKKRKKKEKDEEKEREGSVAAGRSIETVVSHSPSTTSSPAASLPSTPTSASASTSASTSTSTSASTSPSPSTSTSTSRSPLSYLSVSVILGLHHSTQPHPFLFESGVYVLDGRTRLFTQPFRIANTIDTDTDTATSAAAAASLSPPISSTVQTMWQLSFAEPNETEAKRIASMSSSQQQEYALSLVSTWSPSLSWIHDMISSTSTSTIWATPLYDRTPMIPRSLYLTSNHIDIEYGVVVLVGDAAHPMSMFKGQGANQALMDGPMLVQYLVHGGSNRPDAANPLSFSSSRPFRLTRSQLLRRMSGFERHMMCRIESSVIKSRAAAHKYHSVEAQLIGCIEYGMGSCTTSLTTQQVNVLLQTLQDQAIDVTKYPYPHLLSRRINEIITNLFPT